MGDERCILADGGKYLACLGMSGQMRQDVARGFGPIRLVAADHLGNQLAQCLGHATVYSDAVTSFRPEQLCQTFMVEPVDGTALLQPFNDERCCAVSQVGNIVIRHVLITEGLRYLAPNHGPWQTFAFGKR